MHSKYIHLAGADVEEGILRRAGKLKDGTKHKSALEPRVCICGRENPPTAEYCEVLSCLRPLIVKAAEQRDQGAVGAVFDSVRLELLQQMLNELLKQALAKNEPEEGKPV